MQLVSPFLLTALSFSCYYRMYMIAPYACDILPWSQQDIENRSQKFAQFAKRFARMLDASIDMLGSEIEIVEEQLGDLGASHALMGVTEAHYEVFKLALDETLNTMLGESYYSPAVQQSWDTIYNFMVCFMEEGASVLRPFQKR